MDIVQTVIFAKVVCKYKSMPSCNSDGTCSLLGYLVLII